MVSEQPGGLLAELTHLRDLNVDEHKESEFLFTSMKALQVNIELDSLMNYYLPSIKKVTLYE